MLTLLHSGCVAWQDIIDNDDGDNGYEIVPGTGCVPVGQSAGKTEDSVRSGGFDKMFDTREQGASWW